MIQTDVKKLGTDEHAVNVQVSQTEYDRLYANYVDKLQANIKMPGFRPGKIPRGVMGKKFGAKAHEDTVSELVRNYYAEALEKSGLTPAIQPELELPAVQPETGFQFTIKVVTWPEVKLKALSGLSVIETRVDITDADIQSAVDRLMESHVRYVVEDGRQAKKGDEVTIDFSGLVDGEIFEGSRGEDAKLVLGDGQLIPGFEGQLEGAKAGEEYALDTTFPADYRNAHLADKPVRFEVQIKSVGVAVKASDAEDLAGMLNFEDVGALRNGVRVRLLSEAEQAQSESNRDAALDALLAAHDIDLPEIMIEQGMQQTRERMLKAMRQQGMETRPDAFDAPEYRDELYKKSVRALTISLLLRTMREVYKVSVSDEDVKAELDRQARQYPDQPAAFKTWMHNQKEQMAELRDNLLEKKCVACIMEQARVEPVCISLEEWQKRRDTARVETDDVRETA